MIFSRRSILIYKWVCIVASIVYAIAAGIDTLQNYAAAEPGIVDYGNTEPQVYVAYFLKELVYSTMFIGTAILIELVERLVLRAQKLSLEDLYK